jgi:Protein of unknown function (DUF3168)
MALEGHDVCALIQSLLQADTGPGGVNTLLGGRIYQDIVSREAALPAATIGLVAAPDTATLDGRHVLSTVDVDVRVVAEDVGYTSIVGIARRVDVVLSGAAGTAGESYAYKLRRIDFRRMAESDAGKPYRHLIGTYRTEAHPST